MLDVERGHLRGGDLLTGWILARLKNCAHCEATTGRGAANEAQNGVPGAEGDARPVTADLAEETALDGVPFGEGVMMPVSRSASYVVNEYV